MRNPFQLRFEQIFYQPVIPKQLKSIKLLKGQPKMKTIVFLVTCLSLFILSACSPASTPVPTSTAMPTNTLPPTTAPTNTPTTPPTAVPTLSPADSTGTWSGTYTSSTYGAKSAKFTLEQNGTTVTGTFWSNAGSFGSGTITGTVAGNAITFEVVETTPGCYGDYQGEGTIENSSTSQATLTYSLVGMSLCGGVDNATGILTRE
jgi:hypothetical protein